MKVEISVPELVNLLKPIQGQPDRLVYSPGFHIFKKRYSREVSPYWESPKESAIP